MVLSVAFPSTGLFKAFTNADTPKTSESRIVSWRKGVHICPTRVRNLIASIHSSVVRLGHRRSDVNSDKPSDQWVNATNLVSFTNSCRCLIRFWKTNLCLLKKYRFSDTRSSKFSRTYGSCVASVSLRTLAVMISGRSGNLCKNV